MKMLSWAEVTTTQLLSGFEFYHRILLTVWPTVIILHVCFFFFLKKNLF